MQLKSHKIDDLVGFKQLPHIGKTIHECCQIIYDNIRAIQYGLVALPEPIVKIKKVKASTILYREFYKLQIQLENIVDTKDIPYL